MTPVALEYSRTSALDPAALAVVVALAAKEGALLLGTVEFAGLAEDLAAVGFRAGKDELVRLPATAGRPAIAVIGLGGTDDAAAWRYAVGSAVRQLAKVEHLAVVAPADRDRTLATLEGAGLGSYSYPGKSRPERLLSSVTVHGTAEAEDGVERVLAAVEAVHAVRTLGTTPANLLGPAELGAAAAEGVAGLPVEVTVWEGEDLISEGLGGIEGVGRGSERGARLVKLAYSPADAAGHLALVGKGIAYDTGGLSLKPAASMLGMKTDMIGAASVYAVLRAVARLALPIRVTAWLCIAENMPSGSAIRPGDVLTIRGGTTVEVTNTDAEGRLVMADGLVAASEEHPDWIIDIATLTGAQVVALGDRYSAVLGDRAFGQRVIDAADRAGELLWPMPIPEEMHTRLKTDVADLQNATVGNSAGGMLLAGAFLQRFVGTVDGEKDSERIPWAHLDVAGPSMGPSAGYGFTAPGPNAPLVRTLIELAATLADDGSAPSGTPGAQPSE